jgi:hypothetical protein
MESYPQNTLLDEKLDAELKTKGFVVVPFLNEAEVGNLRQAFSEVNEKNIQGFYATAHAADITFRKSMSENVRSSFQRAFDDYFIDHRLLGGSYIVKQAGGKDVLQPHQDWNIVDESNYRSYNIWVPLVNLDQENGTILVMPNSHTWHRGYRHASIPCYYGNVHDILLEYMVPLYLKAGEALIYDHSLLHASQSNRSENMRIACACGVIPRDVDMLFYWNNAGTIEEYKSSPDFFMTENVFSGPNGLEKIRELDYDFPSINETELYSHIGISPPPKKQEIINIPEWEAEKKTFWQVYTPLNILREIKYRITGN